MLWYTAVHCSARSSRLPSHAWHSQSAFATMMRTLTVDISNLGAFRLLDKIFLKIVLGKGCTSTRTNQEMKTVYYRQIGSYCFHFYLQTYSVMFLSGCVSFMSCKRFSVRCTFPFIGFQLLVTLQKALRQYRKTTALSHNMRLLLFGYKPPCPRPTSVLIWRSHLYPYQWALF